jgi:hypothetical protein
MKLNSVYALDQVNKVATKLEFGFCEARNKLHLGIYFGKSLAFKADRVCQVIDEQVFIKSLMKNSFQLIS